VPRPLDSLRAAGSSSAAWPEFGPPYTTQAAAGAIDLVFLDESEALTHPYLARCWARRGAELRIQAPGQTKKGAILGAFDPVRRRLLVHTSPTKRSTDFITLLDQLGTTERTRPLVAVLDNESIHRSKLTTNAFAERTWLTSVFNKAHSNHQGSATDNPSEEKKPLLFYRCPKGE